MAISIKHAFQSAKGDGPDPTRVQPSNWNAAHDITMATARVLGRITAGTGVVEELTATDIATMVKSTLLPFVYPVGSIYFSNNAVNPNTLFGFGTWVAFGAGRVPVGFNGAETEFDVDEEIGGEKTHTLTILEMPAHTHTRDGHSGDTGSGLLIPARVQVAPADSLPMSDTGSTGGGGAHNNLQPYIVVRMWKRTA